MSPLIKIFICIVVATVFFIAATVVGGAVKASADNKFELSILRDSLIKYLFILIVAVLLYAGGYFGDEVLKDYTTDYINVKNLVAIGLATYAINRAADATKHWIELIGLKADKEDGDPIE